MKSNAISRKLPRNNSCTIFNETKAATICNQGRVANTFTTRLFGLLGKKGLTSGQGLLIRPSSGVHTCGMRFPIDIVSLDRNDRVVGVWPSVGPWRVKGLSLRTRSVLELPSGEIQRSAIQLGDHLTFTAR